jgi:oxygen-independent coproporphyrinogen-3 oxidase
MSPPLPLLAGPACSVLSESLLQRFDKPGPRYTSYPTADRFVETFGAEECLQAMAQRARGAALPLSIYVHVPFCESVCYYCACNKVITRHHERAGPYLDALEAEIALVCKALGEGQPVSQLHFGGGSPTFLGDAELDRLMQMLRQAFDLRDGLRSDRSRRVGHRPRGSELLPERQDAARVLRGAAPAASAGREGHRVEP